MKQLDWYYSTRFKFCVCNKSGQEFQDFFCEIMKSKDDNFQKIKPSGKIGDKKCDGYNSKTGDYYLCYSPEDINKKTTIPNAILKISEDINGIIEKRKRVKFINYVINDRFKGLNPKIQELIDNLREKWKTKVQIKMFSMENLEKICLSLELSDKQRILGYAPNLTNDMKNVDFDMISEIVSFIDKNELDELFDDELDVPDYSEKISYNKLSQTIADKLNNARHFIHKVDEFFEKTTIFNKNDLKNKIKKLYSNACKEIPKDADGYFADRRFLYVLSAITYNNQSKAVIENALVIIALFFESCDIFEKPVKTHD